MTQNISQYWIDKDCRSKLAKDHYKNMDAFYFEDIVNSINNSIIYDDNSIKQATQIRPIHFTPGLNEKSYTSISVVDMDSVSAIFKYRKNRTAVLNFASYKNPGGMFLKGSNAQEESLCHHSTLYNVLSRIPNFYEWNRDNLNKALYKNRAIYSPDILFINGIQKVPCNVITCAAPNFRAASKYQLVSNDENINTLFDRIQFVLQIAYLNCIDTLILGAFGCGVFGQDPSIVADIFNHHLNTEFYNCFETIVFAIPDCNSMNFKAFERKFSK